MALAATALIVSPSQGTATPMVSQSSTADVPSIQAPTDSFQREHAEARDKDVRGDAVKPTAKQRAAAHNVDAVARWNDLGTPKALLATDGPLATGLSRDPLQAARQYVTTRQTVLGLTDRAVASLQPLTVAPLGRGAAVIFRQTFGDLVAGYDGILVVGIRDGSVWYVSSSLAPDAAAPAAPTLTRAEAVQRAIADAGVPDARILRTKLVAMPMPGADARAAYQVTLASIGAQTKAFATYVDARTGRVLVREDLVDYDVDNPEWEVFPATPPTSYSSSDTRQHWCFFPGLGCDEVVGTSASPLPWDVDPATGTTTNTTNGNNAIAVHNWFSNNPFTVGTETATARPDRDYTYPWTNQWFEEGCNPDTFESAQRADIDAARANLFAMHNRMHDWSYHLGFTEEAWNMQRDNFGNGGLGNDPEQGNAQAGGVSGGPPNFEARDNANQITPGDGIAPITNMYMWQPIAGSFYAPCVDGDYDMTVIGHEYGHAITNRMIAGPSSGFSSPQGMSESWGDLMAMEYVNEHGYAPSGLQAYAIGQYVTSDPVAGIRNYNMSRSPLNYSDIAYDLTGLQVHADGEIWSATNFDIRKAFIDRYGAGDAALQKSCANGVTPISGCPGNRRWMQLVFDSYLLMAANQLSQVDARNALVAADLIRFGGANQDIIWNAFAGRGLGEGASSAGHTDADPVPSFRSAYANEATVRFAPRRENGGRVQNAQLFVGHYQARAVPVADTDVTTAIPDSVQMVPGVYEFTIRAPGRGHTRVEPTELRAGRNLTLRTVLRTNLASSSSGATVEGTGINLTSLVDDDEATQWASLNAPVAGQHVIVDLAGNKPTVRRVQVSAMLRPTDPSNPDSGSQARVSALRQFEVLACSIKRGVDCDEAHEFHWVYTSPADAFPSVAPRPRAPDLIIRSFDIPRTKATHLWFEVVTNQCTGAPDYAGEQDQDPRAKTDCTTESAQALNVRAAEFQAFAR
jgi:hypothetical protein